MAKSQKSKRSRVENQRSAFQPKDFLDLIAPAAVKFNTDSYVLAGCTAVSWPSGHPAVTEELALLSHICNRAGVTLHLYARQVTAAEEDAIYHKGQDNKNRLDRSNQDNLEAECHGGGQPSGCGRHHCQRPEEPGAPHPLRRVPGAGRQKPRGAAAAAG